MTTFRYVFGSLRSGEVIEEIPLFGVYMDMEMNVGGQFQGTFQLDMTGKDNATLIDACEPGRTWVAVERNGTAVWSGFLWSRTYSAQSKTVQLFASSFEKYTEKRRVAQDTAFTATEQRDIMRFLWSQMQSDNGSNLGINVPAAFAAAVTRDLTVLAVDNARYSDVISSIANGDDGFDWRINITKDGENYRRDLLIGYPTLGTEPSAGMVVFEYPGNITQYYYTEAMANAATNVNVIGSGEGSTLVLGQQEDTDLINSGMARWDYDVSRKDISDQALIDTLAIQEAIKRRPPMPVFKIDVKADKSPEFGSYSLGDSCGISVRDARFPSGMDVTKRLLRWELRPQSSEHTEEASLTFEGDPDV